MLKKGFAPKEGINRKQYTILKDESIRFPITRRIRFRFCQRRVSMLSNLMLNQQPKSSCPSHYYREQREDLSRSQKKLTSVHGASNEDSSEPQLFQNVVPKYNRNKEVHKGYIAISKAHEECEKEDMWSNFKSFKRTKYSFGFHIRFSNLKVNEIKHLVLCMLLKTISSSMKGHNKKYSILKIFFLL